jgi:hypothetical protein
MLDISFEPCYNKTAEDTPHRRNMHIFGRLIIMGMTDKQFDGYLRMLLRRLEEIDESQDPNYKSKKMKEVIEDIQKTIED